jgi:hemerythrin-like domain-containing protein
MDFKSTLSIAEEHGALREAARRIRALLEGGPCACRTKNCVDCLREGTNALAERLRTHFTAEEVSWRSADDRGRDRATRNWIDRLVREHAQIRERMDVLVAELEETRRRQVSAAAALRSRLHALLDDLVEHELSEARLFQRSRFEHWGSFD